ncbi:MAG: hypothetical protein HYT80_12245 [Euryarchaeota archaeon]|nr:hypothetical protein [Euryarchaeota archaeon]
MRLPVLALAIVFLIPAFAGCLGGDAGTKDAGPLKQGGKAAKAGGVGAVGSFVAVAADGTIVDASLLLGVPSVAGEQRFLGTNTFEPTIGINKEGHLFMVAFGGGAKIYKSTTKGVSWTDTTANLGTNPQNGRPIYNPPNSNDPFVWVDRETGRVFSSDLQALICSWLNYSDDGGKSWVTNPIGCGHPFGVHDHQSITTGKARATPSAWSNRMVYYCINRVGDSSCAASSTGGLSFGPLVPVMMGVDVERGGFCGGLTGHAKTDNAGRVLWGKNQCGVPMVATPSGSAPTGSRTSPSARTAARPGACPSTWRRRASPRPSSTRSRQAPKARSPSPTSAPRTRAASATPTPTPGRARSGTGTSASWSTRSQRTR